MNLIQDFEDNIIAGNNDNYLVIDSVIDFIDVTYTIQGVSNNVYTNRYASINGRVELNVKEITKLVYGNVYNYTDPFDYSSNVLYTETDPYHYIKLELNIQDNSLNAPIIKDVVVLNSALQNDDSPLGDYEDDVLRLVSKMPYFTNILQSISVLRSNGIERIKDKNNIIFSERISETIDDCGVGVKWLNSLGGYSYWLFNEKYKEKIKTKQLGFIKNHSTVRIGKGNDKHSLGFTATKEKNLTSLVKNEYYKEVETLFTSPEVYIYKNDKYVKVNISNSSVSSKSYRTQTKINLTLLLNDVVTQRFV